MPTDERLESAIVIGYVDYGEQDRIVTLLSSETGRLTAMAKGARSASKQSGLIDLGNTLSVTLKKGKGDLFKLGAAEIKDGRHRLRQDLHKIAHLSYFCEISAVLAQENAPQPKLYGLLSATLNLLGNSVQPLTTAFHVGYECKALAFSGHLPRLSRCGECNQSIQGDEKVLFSPIEGGVWHAACLNAKAQNRCYAVDVNWLRSVSACIGRPLSEALEVTLPPGPEWSFSEMIEDVTQKRLKSKHFLQQIMAAS